MAAFESEKKQFALNPIRHLITVGYEKGGVPVEIIYQHFFMEMSRYVNHVSRWLTIFPKEQVLLVRSEDLRNHIQHTMDQVFEFVGVSPHIVNPVLHNEGSRIKHEIHAVLRDELAKYFAPFNKQLNEYLKKVNYPYLFDWDEGLTNCN